MNSRKTNQKKNSDKRAYVSNFRLQYLLREGRISKEKLASKSLKSQIIKKAITKFK